MSMINIIIIILPEHFDIDRLLMATTADVAVAFANIALLNILILLLPIR